MVEESVEIMLDDIIRISRSAGEKILSVYNGSEIEVEYKGDNSPLTMADQLAHELIVSELDKLDINYPILSEEGNKVPFEERQSWERYWLIDPLDGTKEFIKRNGEFTVNIALIENGIAIMGVVHAPVLDVTYYAAVGIGAFKQHAQEPALSIQVSNRDINDSWKVVASRSHLSKETEELIKNLGESEFVSMGSSLKLCLIAEGVAHLYPRLALTSEWDTAAAQCVVEQAGGKVVTTELLPLLYNTKDSMLNPFFIVCTTVDDSWSTYLKNNKG